MLMVLGMTSAFAATIKVGNGGESAATWAGTGPASITVTLPTPYTSDQLSLGAKNDNVYHIYKVFDATVANGGISYTVMAGKTDVPTGFTKDANGYVTHAGDATELTPAEIAAIKTYINGDTPVVTVTTSNESSFTVSGLEYGYYFIDTTVGTLVTVNSTNPNANVSDKNEIPPLNKKITGASSYDTAGLNAIAQVGTNVEFTVDLTIAKGAKNYSFHDLMTNGLKFNRDVVVYTQNPGPQGTDRSSMSKLTASQDYTADYTAGGTGAYAYTFKVDLADEYVADHEDQVLYFVYSAEVTNAALTTDPENNTAWLDYGQTPGENHTPKKTVHVYSAKVVVYKDEEVAANTAGAVENTETHKWYKPLAGAGFVLQNSDNKYYKFTGTDTDGEPLVEWVDSIDDASEYTSQNTGYLDHEFVGLPAGTYTLVEKTVPASYTKAPNQTITINAADSNDEHKFEAVNLVKSLEVENKQGTALPSTGGIGTTLFYIGGGILVLAAVILLVTKRRMNAND